MPELDAFERNLEAAFRAFADRGVAPVDAVAFAERAAGGPRRHAWLAWPQATGRLATVPAIAWVLLATGLMLGLVVGGLAVGLWRDPDRALVVEPTPTPTAIAFPTGTWTATNDLGMPLVLEFRPDETWKFTRDGEEMSTGTYSADEAVITFLTDSMCREQNAERGTYTWSYENDQLTLAKRDDRCTVGRVTTMDGKVWTRAPLATTVVDEASDILATTKAKPLPAQAACPPGSDPDAPGPLDQERPSGYWVVVGAGGMAFDRRAGRIVVLAGVGEGAAQWQTWTYDVCTNTWHRMSPPEEPPSRARLVYDVDSDRTLAFTNADDPSDYHDIWSYDSAADRWTKLGSFPGAGDETSNPTYGTIFYHDPSGLVVLYDGATMWAYDVESNTLARVRQQPDPLLPTGSGLPEGKIAFGYDPEQDLVVAVVVPYAGESSDRDPNLPARVLVPQRPWGETWTFDPGTGAWQKEASPAASDLIVCGAMWRGSTECYPTNGRAVFDEAAGLTVFITRDYGMPAAPGRVDAYDAGQRAWHTLSPATGSGGDGAYWCTSMPPVYDLPNGRIVCLGPDNPGGLAGVSAFSSATGQWRWLLEPGPAVSPAP